MPLIAATSLPAVARPTSSPSTPNTVPLSARIEILPSAIADSGWSVPTPATLPATGPSSSLAEAAPAQWSSTWRVLMRPVPSNICATSVMTWSRTARITTSVSSSRSGGAEENAATPAIEPARRAGAARRAHRPRTGTPPRRSAPASAVATGPAPTMNVVGLRAVTAGTGGARRYTATRYAALARPRPARSGPADRAPASPRPRAS